MLDHTHNYTWLQVRMHTYTSAVCECFVDSTDRLGLVHFRVAAAIGCMELFGQPAEFGHFNFVCRSARLSAFLCQTWGERKEEKGGAERNFGAL